MQYSTEELIEMSLKAINEEDCVTFDEVSLFLPVSRATFYNHGLDKVDIIKEAITAKKVQLKKKLRRNWRNSDNAVLQIAEFKLMATDEERDAITQSKVKQESSVSIQGKPTITIDFIDASTQSTSE